MTQNLYNYYAGLLHLVQSEEQLESVKEMLRFTPYYFSEPVDLRSAVPCIPEQFNLPSPETMIQCDLQFITQKACLVFLLNEPKREVTIYRAIGNSIGAHSIGDIHKDHDGYLRLRLWQMEEDQPERHWGFKPQNKMDDSLDEIYSIMVNRLLVYVNRLAPRSPQVSLPRPQRRAAGRSLGYPLKATTEIRISQHPPVTMRTRTGQGGHKCLHEVKGHVRIYHRGTPQEFCVWIRSHDRGDAKYGVKKTKYKVDHKK
jgi:hypothetical protein